MAQHNLSSRPVRTAEKLASLALALGLAGALGCKPPPPNNPAPGLNTPVASAPAESGTVGGNTGITGGTPEKAPASQKAAAIAAFKRVDKVELDAKALAAAKERSSVKAKTISLTDEKIELKSQASIKFKTNSTELLPESYTTLNEVGTILKDHPAFKVRIEGHTDSDGEIQSNYDLSAKRAAVVVAYLKEWGIDVARLDSVGCGEDVPLSDNSTPESKAQNRRVEFVLIKEGANVDFCRLYKK